MAARLMIPTRPDQTGRPDNAQFGKMSSQGIDCLSALTDEQISCFEHHSGSLLVLCFCRHVAHDRPRDCFANSLGVCGVSFIAFD